MKIFRPLVVLFAAMTVITGIAYRPIGAAAILRRNLLLYGVGGITVPFVGMKLIDMLAGTIGLA